MSGVKNKNLKYDGSKKVVKIANKGIEHAITKQYLEWVNSQYRPTILDPKSVNRFISLDDSLTLNLLERIFLYCGRGFNIMLDGGTGSGKTTLAKNIAAIEKIPFFSSRGNKELYVQKALIAPTYFNDSSETHPGELAKAAIFDGIFYIEEAANMNRDHMVDFHPVLDKERINIPTHFGVVEIDLNEIDNFRTMMGGNFSYQKPDFYNSTFQRFVWVMFDYLANGQFKDTLATHGTEKEKLGGVAGQDYQISDKIARIYGEGVTAKQQDVASNLLTAMRDELEELGFGLDQNMACYKRALECYSPNLTTKDYEQILCETILYPIAGTRMFRGNGDTIKAMKKTAFNCLKRYKNLFSEKRMELKGYEKG